MRGGRPSILALAIISEAFLVALAYIIAWVSSLPLHWNPTLEGIALGCAISLPLLLANEILWTWSARHRSSVFYRFSAEIIIPLCREIRILHIPIVALLSGIGEEALFRGALNLLLLHYASPTTALIVTSIAFAYVHFIGSVRRFGGMIPLYTIVGGILWLVWAHTNSLAAAAATHALYNCAAIMWVKYRTRRS